MPAISSWGFSCHKMLLYSSESATFYSALTRKVRRNSFFCCISHRSGSKNKVFRLAGYMFLRCTRAFPVIDGWLEHFVDFRFCFWGYEEL